MKLRHSTNNWKPNGPRRTEIWVNAKNFYQIWRYACNPDYRTKRVTTHLHFQLELTNLVFLPTSNITATKQELLLARDVLEIGVQWAIEANNIPAFERF